MFEHQITDFGGFELHRLFDPASGDAFSVVPSFGACLISLQFGGAEMLDSYPTGAEMVKNSWSKSAILVPYPNRLRDGEYEWKGKKYDFPKNNAPTGNSIHGFAKDAPMTVKSVQLTSNSAKIVSEWQYRGENAGFPFPFLLRISMSLTKKRHFEMSMTVKNLHDTPIPMGLGWHPYFSLAGARADETSLQMPKNVHLIDIDERMLPTGKKTPFSGFETLKSLKNENLDNGFFIHSDEKKAITTLKTSQHQLDFWQKTGAELWNFLQVFTPPHRQSVAVEPMTCNIDAFNNKDGLKILQPNETFGGSFGVQYKRLA